MVTCAKGNPNQTLRGMDAVAPSTTKLGKGTPHIVLPLKETNVEAVRSFMLNCLVPILAEEFLHRRDRPEDTENEPISSNPTFAPLGRENGR